MCTSGGGTANSGTGETLAAALLGLSSEERVEASLTGRQMTLAAIRADRAHPSMMASSRTRLDRMFIETPLCHRIGEAIEATAKGKDRAAMWRSIKAHQRDAVFLMHLWTECNTRVLDDQRDLVEMIDHLATLNMLLLEMGRHKGAERDKVETLIGKAHGWPYTS